MNVTNLKICGITSPDTARYCAAAGVGALGVVFYPRSPRYVSPARARDLFAGLPPRVARVGVFVDLPAADLLAAACEATLSTIQLHGSEPLETVLEAQAAGFRVIKVLKETGDRLLAAAAALPASVGILVECGTGALPGGNGAVWNWADAAPLAAVRPFALAGGLTADTICAAARLSRAAAWDLSSGVETAPGVKDHAAIARAVAALDGFLRLPSASNDSFDSLRFWSKTTHP
jgi:phosphoribosylanthranilate isomerase